MNPSGTYAEIGAAVNNYNKEAQGYISELDGIFGN